MRVPFAKTVGRLTNKGSKLEIFILYYLLLSIILHLAFNLYLKDNMVFVNAYKDDVTFTLFNLIVLIAELVNFIGAKITGDNLEFLNILMNLSDQAYEVVRRLIYSNKYSAFIFSNLTWTYVYIFTGIIIVVNVIKKFIRFAISLWLIGIVVYVIYSSFSSYFITAKYDDAEYMSRDDFTNAQVVEVEVTDIVDGDTIKVMYEGSEVTVRLLYIDTPEYTKEIEEYGFEATQALKGIINKSDRVYLEFDGDRYDKYERLLA